MNYIRNNFSLAALSTFLGIALFNPWLMKYDYGAGWPMVLLFGVTLASLAVAEFRVKRERAIWEKFWLVIFMGAVMASFVFSQTKNLGFSEVMAFLSVVCLYLIYAYQKLDWSEQVLKVVASFTVIAVVLGYIHYIFLPETRMFGPFFNLQYHANVWPNAFALFLLMTWPIFIVISEKKHHWKSGVLISIVLSALLLTFSRGALLVLGGQLVLLLAYFWRRLDLKKIGLVLLTGVFAVALFVNANYVRSTQHEVIDVGERAAFVNSESLTSKQERIDFWLGAIELTKEKPLFGWGPFSFRQAYNAKQTTLLANADHPHNVFLKISAENGLIAAGSFVIFLLLAFFTVAKRFGKLPREKRDAVYVLGVAVAGAFAHNMIDYNLNFMVNLVLLFLLMALIRSYSLGKRLKVRGAFLAVFLSVIIAGVALFEGALLFMDTQVFDKSYLGNSFYPRGFYLANAEMALANEDYDSADIILDKQLELNSLDDRAYYLKGVVSCKKNEMVACKNYFVEALELNGQNDIRYYVDYFRALDDAESKQNFAAVSQEMLEQYFIFVGNNVHFTAYTPNVEAAAELVDLIVPFVENQSMAELISKKEKMLETAEILRSQKTF